jgi:hypothetical protein
LDLNANPVPDPKRSAATGDALAVWLVRAAAALALVGRIAFVLILLGGLLALAAGAFGGRFGALGVQAEWRALGPAVVSGLAHAAALAFVADRLKAVFATLSAGDPFVPANAGRIRAIACALAALEAARWAVQAATAAILALAGPPAQGSLQAGFSPNVVALAAVAVLWALAQVFEAGARLRRRDRLTI